MISLTLMAFTLPFYRFSYYYRLSLQSYQALIMFLLRQLLLLCILE